MTNAQMKNINAYVEAFLTEHGDENIVELWQEATNQQNFIKLIKVDKKSSGKKDPNKPKRGKSAYLFFCAEHREKAKKELGEGAKATEVTAELGRQWNELKASTKASDKKKLEKYEKQAREDKERYESEMVNYVHPPNDEEKANKEKEEKEEKEMTLEMWKKELEEKEKKKAKEEKAKEKEEKEKKEKEKKEKEEKEKKEKKTGFDLFCEEFREYVEQEAPDEAENYYECALLEMWMDLDEEELQEWEHRASMM